MMLASRIAALTIATGALVAAAGPAFADDGGYTSQKSDWKSAVTIDPNPAESGAKLMVSVSTGHGMGCKPGTKSATAWSDGFKDGKISLSPSAWDGKGGKDKGGDWTKSGEYSQSAFSTDDKGKADANKGDKSGKGDWTKDDKSGKGDWSKDDQSGKGDWAKGGKGDWGRHGSLSGWGRATWRPGWYSVKVTCDDERRPSAFGQLRVVPRGADTGDGGSILATGATTTQKTSGIALLGSAAGIGVFGLRRKLKAYR